MQAVAHGAVAAHGVAAAYGVAVAHGAAACEGSTVCIVDFDDTIFPTSQTADLSARELMDKWGSLTNLSDVVVHTLCSMRQHAAVYVVTNAGAAWVDNVKGCGNMSALASTQTWYDGLVSARDMCEGGDIPTKLWKHFAFRSIMDMHPAVTRLISIGDAWGDMEAAQAMTDRSPELCTVTVKFPKAQHADSLLQLWANIQLNAGEMVRAACSTHVDMDTGERGCVQHEEDPAAHAQ